MAERIRTYNLPLEFTEDVVAGWNEKSSFTELGLAEFIPFVKKKFS